ncbi:hypothetical protein [Methylomonas albis]|uniref:Uncharacterized protein n=1 Tax=Methylomonas albis TaxID=1854563 RepID=A0ABR9D1P9_9GAMM|nr:hypothetical protein [Methylomonas albis]MBD9357028.1 hypothetical protein [Methylomonas albis]
MNQESHTEINAVLAYIFTVLMSEIIPFSVSNKQQKSDLDAFIDVALNAQAKMLLANGRMP